MTWYKKKMLSKDSMPNVNESVNENNSLGENPITSDELNEDEVKHDPFEFPHDEEIPFSRLLYDMIVWHVQGFDNGNANLNMSLLDDHVQVSNTPPLPPMMYML